MATISLEAYLRPITLLTLFCLTFVAKQWEFCATLSSHVATAICKPASGRPQADSQQSTPGQPTCRDHWQVWAVPAVSQECQGHQCSTAALHRKTRFRSLNHLLNGSGIRAWLTCLKKEAARITFCVPAGLYSRYKKQSAVNLALEYHCR